MLQAVGVGETARLLGAAINGEATAREALLARFRPRVVLWIAARLSAELRAKLEPEDIAQDVLLSIHRGLDHAELRDASAFLAWAFTVAENQIRDAARHFGAKKRQTVEPRSAVYVTPSSVASRQEEVSRMRAALERLPDAYRDIVRLRSLEERSYRECGDLLGRSEAAARVLHCRALAQLRSELEDRHG